MTGIHEFPEIITLLTPCAPQLAQQAAHVRRPRAARPRQRGTCSSARAAPPSPVVAVAEQHPSPSSTRAPARRRRRRATPTRPRAVAVAEQRPRARAPSPSPSNTHAPARRRRRRATPARRCRCRATPTRHRRCRATPARRLPRAPLRRASRRMAHPVAPLRANRRPKLISVRSLLAIRNATRSWLAGGEHVARCPGQRGSPDVRPVRPAVVLLGARAVAPGDGVRTAAVLLGARTVAPRSARRWAGRGPSPSNAPARRRRRRATPVRRRRRRATPVRRRLRRATTPAAADSGARPRQRGRHVRWPHGRRRPLDHEEHALHDGLALRSSGARTANMSGALPRSGGDRPRAPLALSVSWRTAAASPQCARRREARPVPPDI